jgi:hypothetical protein
VILNQIRGTGERKFRDDLRLRMFLIRCDGDRSTYVWCETAVVYRNEESETGTNQVRYTDVMCISNCNWEFYFEMIWNFISSMIFILFYLTITCNTFILVIITLIINLSYSWVIKLCYPLISLLYIRIRREKVRNELFVNYYP